MHRHWMAGLAVLLVAGCGGSSHQASTPRPAQPAPRRGDEAIIRGWNQAVNSGDYIRAGSYFAPGAIVVQSFALPLPTQKIAAEWNSGFPCRADITFIQPERTTSIAGFHLREGPHGDCKQGGSARVRFTIRRGLIRRWQQIFRPSPQRQPQVPAT